mmetsp:Transcript_20225/g.33526  ORF Transcript_20225/g.33526 Transcript_20225/m.33526 type:complete len:201 (-) Transcript_20225:165-767(-)|eukprot:CAMPEP_0119018100 /NCGR_PEP_ID=MMETSP1176-20130426/18571_1 /TAXON_ID=265551 /ORGANISM="Synedropsis recta cf, Strain CCMP1620" /LENGTH=200 /DNA_ID=CAMNT_0006972027 /DNA_START=514 /DNA_END=1119 /DNA_ORIENTATION=+
MPPAPKMGDNYGPLHVQVPLVEMASVELERIRLETDEKYHSFPPACLSFLKSVNGNAQCMDCNGADPQWATVTYGALLCLNCSGKHRSLGVQISSVRSITMDSWSHIQVLAMLEGGNLQLRAFFNRHKLNSEAKNESPSVGPITKENVTIMRYKTKAALFYREQLTLHVNNVFNSGEYKGREASRRLRHRSLDQRNSTVL